MEYPLHAITYVLISLPTAGIIAYYYIQVSGQSAEDVAARLKAVHLTTPGHRESLEALREEVAKYVPPTAVMGGVLAALIALIAEFCGAFGSGPGLVLAVSCIDDILGEVNAELKRTGQTPWFK
jgi:protein transport protein SEC61 subunit alpha